MSNLELPTYNMQKLENKILNGKTNPLLVETDNGFYVAKVRQNVDGPRVLVNEFVCYKLAKILAIPIPEAALIKLDQEVIDADPNLQDLEVEPGLHFGSKLIPKAESSIQPPLVSIVENIEDIPSIILFDQIIYNDDRTDNPGNLLIDLKERRILAIDHSHPFKQGALWDKGELTKILEEPICLVRDFRGRNYRVLLKYVNGHSPFNKIQQKIADISFEDIAWCLEHVPEEWELSSEDEAALIDFLWHRINNTQEILKLLKDQCPDWKGGGLFEEE